MREKANVYHCPFCSKAPQLHKGLVCCQTKTCPMYGVVSTVDAWNQQPTIKLLEKELQESHRILTAFYGILKESRICWSCKKFKNNLQDTADACTVGNNAWESCDLHERIDFEKAEKNGTDQNKDTSENQS